MGNVSLAASSTACCQDYVIASPSSSLVRVLFSADLPGLSFLADLPDELVDVGGPGVDDVLLAADLDCDGDLDLAVTAPGADAFVPLVGTADGTFAASAPIPAGSAPQDLAVGDVDGDGDPDVAVSNDDGGFTVVLNNCNGSFGAPTSYEVYPTPTPNMPIAMGKLCPGHPNDMAVAVGIFDIVYLTCGDGTGSFADVVEPHGVEVAAPYDYFWDPTNPGLVAEPRITDLFVWSAGPSLYALRQRSVATSDLRSSRYHRM